jgi:hypothetical protein
MNEQIKKFLDNKAANDMEFAARYANPAKSIEKCMAYIYEEVYRIAKEGCDNPKCIYMPEDQVYGMAMHYYDEEMDSDSEPELVTAKGGEEDDYCLTDDDIMSL